MLVAKTESGNACPTSAASARATVIQTIASSSGIKSGHHGAEHDQQHDQRGRQAEAELAVLQVLARQRREVGVERELAGDRGVEPAAAVGGLHRIDDALDVVLGVRPERHQHPGGIAIAGHQSPLAAVVEGGHLRRAGSAAGPPRALAPAARSAAHRPSPSRSERRPPRLTPRQAPLVGKALEPQLVRAPRLRVARDLLVARQGVPEKRRGDRDRRHQRQRPARQRQPRPATAPDRESLGHRARPTGSAPLPERVAGSVRVLEQRPPAEVLPPRRRGELHAPLAQLVIGRARCRRS